MQMNRLFEIAYLLLERKTITAAELAQREPESVARMRAFLEANGLTENFDDLRKHHEIYLSDPRITAPEKMKTVLRHPVRRI
uniref:hypothetical protein n=1 Tax=Paenibacillus sp. FSL K6-2441 TaxID=2954679 RepID=UPI00403F83B3